VGSSVTFTITATGTPPPSYQWRRNGSPITGATGATLTIASVTTANAGSYDVVVSNSAGTATSNAVLLTVNPAGGSVSLGDLVVPYDGAPQPVEVITSPSGLPVTVTYNGSPTPPTLPGTYNVVATINSPDYFGTTSGTEVITITGVVRHAPTLNGAVDGSLQVLSAEATTLNGSASVSDDLLMPGLPAVKLNGHPNFGGTVDGTGAATPTNYTITLNGGSTLRHLVRRIDAIAMPAVSAPPAPTGTRDVTLNSAGQSPGSFTTMRNLTLNGNYGTLAVPAGTYGSFTVNGSSSLVFGVAGGTTPAVYNLQGLTLNGSSRITIVGPVMLKLANGTALNGSIGNSSHPEWLDFQIASGSLTLNGSVSVSGYVDDPSGTITINGGCVLSGEIKCDRLTINGNGLLIDPGL
jgi:rhamnogalacturonan endolyase